MASAAITNRNADKVVGIVTRADGVDALAVDISSDVETATTNSTMNVTLTNANTEYSQALPSGTKQLRFRARTAEDVRYAWVTGYVATPLAPYLTLPAGMGLAADALSFTSKTLYFATTVSGTIVELEALT